MATHSISGNVVTASAIVYLKATGDYPQPSPNTTVADGSGSYTFSGLSDGIYEVYTAKSFTAGRTKVRVIVSGDDHADVNLSA